MQKLKNQIILTQEDYDIIMSNLKSTHSQMMFTKENAEELEAELKRAKLVKKEKAPEDVVRLNSVVKVKEDKAERVMELTLVTPEKADIKQRKISVMSPIGTALIGYKKGTKVSWKVPAGEKTFTILDVSNIA